MNTQVATLVTIVGVVCTVISIYLLAKSNARDNDRRRQEIVDKAVKDAVDPVIVQRDDARQERDVARREVTRLNNRVDSLEDQLRGMV